VSIGRTLAVVLPLAALMLACGEDSENPAAPASSSWSAVPSGTTKHLRAVWGVSDTDVFAVGDSGTVLRFDGLSWAPMPIGTKADLTGIWGTSASNVFATSSNDTVFHFDGVAWRDTVQSAGRQWLCVWGASSADVFLANDQNEIVRHETTGWETMVVPPGYFAEPRINTLWGSAANDVFAGRKGDILRYEGVDWEQSHFDANIEFLAVWGSSGTNVFAAGQLNGHTPAMVRFNGTVWEDVNIPPLASNTTSLRAIWGTSASDVYCVGDGGAILHFNGTRWSRTTMIGGGVLSGVWGASPTDIFVVGNDGAIFQYDP